MIKGHVLFAGTTESGKTTGAIIFSRRYRLGGIASLVLDPLNDPRWPSPHRFKTASELYAQARKSRNCALFIDEAAVSMDRYDIEMNWFATMSRHWGHRAHFMCQRQNGVNPSIRGNCGSYVIFRVDWDDAKELAKNFTRRELIEASELPLGECIIGTRFEPPTRCRIDFQAMTLEPIGRWDAGGTFQLLQRQRKAAS